jgi:methionyl-tRNA formyltransferase
MVAAQLRVVASHLSAVSRILFLGSKSLGLRILPMIAAVAPGSMCAALTIDDRGEARSRFDQLEGAAAASGVPFHVAHHRGEADALIQRERPDLCVVAGWYWLVPAETLQLVPRGFVGIHNSLLPRYRGGAPLVWALINGETEVGASIFSLRDGADDGPVWMQARISVGADEHIGEVLERLEQETVRMFAEGFPGILSGTAVPAEQDHARATYCAQRRPDDGEIDWSRPADRVFDFIRAQAPPYPGAFTFLAGKKMVVVRAGLVPYRFDGTPGQVIARQGESVLIACGDGTAVRLMTVDLGTGAVAASEVVRTTQVRFPRHAGAPATVA